MNKGRFIPRSESPKYSVNRYKLKDLPVEITVDWDIIYRHWEFAEICAMVMCCGGIVVSLAGALQNTPLVFFLGGAFVQAGFFIKSRHNTVPTKERLRQQVLEQLNFDPDKELPKTHTLHIRETKSGKVIVGVRKNRITEPDAVEDAQENVAKQKTAEASVQETTHVVQNTEDDNAEFKRRGPFEGGDQIFTYCLILLIIGYVFYKGFIE